MLSRVQLDEILLGSSEQWLADATRKGLVTYEQSRATMKLTRRGRERARQLSADDQANRQDPITSP